VSRPHYWEPRTPHPCYYLAPPPLPPWPPPPPSLQLCNSTLASLRQQLLSPIQQSHLKTPDGVPCHHAKHTLTHHLPNRLCQQWPSLLPHCRSPCSCAIPAGVQSRATQAATPNAVLPCGSHPSEHEGQPILNLHCTPATSTLLSIAFPPATSIAGVQR
jgi:hypothetical protein